MQIIVTKYLKIMKNYIFIFLIVSFIFSGCHKNCPEPGSYQMHFTGTYQSNGNASNETGSITISETSDDSFYIGNTKMEKDGKNFNGELCCLTSYSLVNMEGKCSRKKGVYYLSGTYEASDYSGGIIKGEFEIKQN